jgi:hypothetical protein
MRRLPPFLLACLIVSTLSGSPVPAAAQLSLPHRPLLPSVVPGIPSELRGLTRGAATIASAVDLAGMRHEIIADLLQRRRDALEPDPAGEPVIRQEVLVTAPSATLLRAAADAGFRILREETLDALGLRVVVLKTPVGTSTPNAVQQLRTIDPDAAIDFNHVYTGSGNVTDGGPQTPPPSTGRPAVDASAAAMPRDTPRIGLIDSGIDAGHPAFHQASIERSGCNGAAHPDMHGTAVASLMVGRGARFKGVAPSARLYAVDVYCGMPGGGATDAIVAALGWLARQQVGVVNVSLVGPPNRVLETAVRAMLARGHLMVAAVGNDGPAAPPLYPASYAGVIGVTAIDGRDRVLPEAARGAQVMFAAPGADMLAASTETGGLAPVRGTSFAAPIVAAMLAETLPGPDVAMARMAVERMITEAVHGRRADHQGTASINSETGYGAVGLAFRVRPPIPR